LILLSLAQAVPEIIDALGRLLDRVKAGQLPGHRRGASQR
jgi:hypothetical protein